MVADRRDLAVKYGVVSSGSAGIFPYSVLIPASSRRFKLPRLQELGIGNGRTEDPIPSDRMIVS